MDRETWISPQLCEKRPGVRKLAWWRYICKRNDYSSTFCVPFNSSICSNGIGGVTRFCTRVANLSEDAFRFLIFYWTRKQNIPYGNTVRCKVFERKSILRIVTEGTIISSVGNRDDAEYSRRLTGLRSEEQNYDNDAETNITETSKKSHRWNWHELFGFEYAEGLLISLRSETLSQNCTHLLMMKFLRRRVYFRLFVGFN